jgi:hypothetical protein
MSFYFYSELQKLHKQFVLGNILTESEFWATRKVNFFTIYVICCFFAFCLAFEIGAPYD